jgi:hypothetical protein
MTYEQHRRTVVHDDGGPHDEHSVGYEDRVTTSRPSGAELVSRVVVFVFGVVQLIIALRIFLLAIGAQEGNSIVRLILDLSRPLVAPFEGILRTDALHSAGATFDTTALIALVGWTVLEVMVLALVRIFRREPV